MAIVDENEIDHYLVKTYTGTVESYNELVSHIGDDPLSPIVFLDENGSSTWKFTGIVMVYKLGVIYKPGDVYNIKIPSCIKNQIK